MTAIGPPEDHITPPRQDFTYRETSEPLSQTMDLNPGELIELTTQAQEGNNLARTQLQNAIAIAVSKIHNGQ